MDFPNVGKEFGEAHAIVDGITMPQCGISAYRFLCGCKVSQATATDLLKNEALKLCWDQKSGHQRSDPPQE